MDRITRFLIALSVLMLPALASAQPIHDHPQKSVYASSAEYPFIEQQCQLKGGAVEFAHTHLGFWWPYRAEVNAPFRVRFRRAAGGRCLPDRRSAQTSR